MKVYLVWLLATAAGGAFIGYMAAPTDFLWELVMSGFVVGIAQWIVLRRYIKSVVWWIPLSGFGWILGTYLMIFTGEIFNPIVQFLTSFGGLWEVFWLNVTRQPINFAVFGFAQWLLLRRHFRYAGYWILASALGGVARGAVGSYICAVACQVGGGIISNAAGWAASGAITGTVLIWLINNHRKKLP